MKTNQLHNPLGINQLPGGLSPWPAWVWDSAAEPNAGLDWMFYMEHFVGLRCREARRTEARSALDVLHGTLCPLMFYTAKLYFFRIVLDPGVNTKIFLDGVHKNNIYKFHTMGARSSMIVAPRN